MCLSRAGADALRIKGVKIMDKIEICLDCEYCDVNRTNDLEQVRCTRFSTYVEPLHGCDEFTKKGGDE